MNQKDYREIVKNKSLSKEIREQALQNILDCVAPGSLKELLGDDDILVALTLEIHDKKEKSPCFNFLKKSLGL